MKGIGNCSNCNSELDMYYTPWCPKCDKPEVDQVTVTRKDKTGTHTTYRQELNLIKALRYIEAQGHPGFKDRMWKHLCDYETIKGNDTASVYWFDPDHEDDVLIQKTFELGEQVTFQVSW